MRPIPVIAQAAFVGLSAFAVWQCFIASGTVTGLKLHAASICDASLPASVTQSWPQTHAPRGIQLDWFGTRGGLPCRLVNLFQAAVAPHHGFATPSTPAIRTFFLSFLSYLPTLVSLLTLSCSHRGLPSLAPVIGALYQLFTAGVIIPTAITPGLYSPPARSARPGQARKLGSLEVEALTVAVIVGAVLPTCKLVTERDDQSWTMVWQLFPVYVWAVQKAYIFVGKTVFARSDAKGNAGSALRALYTLLAISSLSAHFRILRLALTSPLGPRAVLTSLFVPSLTPTPLSYIDGVHRFLQYDYLVTHLALIAFLTFRSQIRGLQRKLAFAYFLCVLSLAGGPALALLAGWWWVEERGWSEE